MSVIKSKRTESEMEFISNARELQIYTVKKCTGFPKRYTFYVSQPIANIATQIHHNVKCANSIYPTTKSEAEMRKMYLKRATAETQSLISQIEIAAELFGIEENSIKHWMALIKKEIRLIQAVLKRDRERFKNLT